MAREEKAKSRSALPPQGTTSGSSTATTLTTYGKIITIYSPKGGTGCTTIAVNLAVALNNEETPVVLVDGNLQYGDVAVFLNEQGKNSVVDLAPRAEELDPEIIDGVMISHAASGIKVIAAPFRPEYAENVTGEQFVKVLKYLCRLYSYVLVDTSSALNDVTLGSLQDASDMIVMVTTQDIPSIQNARLFLDLTDQLGIERRRIMFIMLPEGTGAAPSIPAPGSIPSDILPADPFTQRTISLSSLTLSIQRFNPDDYTSPVLPADSSNSIPRFTWEDLFTPPPKFCGCGGCS